MTPQEKAKELRQLFAQELIDLTHFENLLNARIKECALIAVQELIYQCHGYREIDLGLSLEYWEEVKQEIEKL